MFNLKSQGWHMMLCFFVYLFWSCCKLDDFAFGFLSIFVLEILIWDVYVFIIMDAMISIVLSDSCKGGLFHYDWDS